MNCLTQCPNCLIKWKGSLDEVIHNSHQCITCKPRKHEDTEIIDWLQASPNPRFSQWYNAWIKLIGGLSVRDSVRVLMSDKN